MIQKRTPLLVIPRPFVEMLAGNPLRRHRIPRRLVITAQAPQLRVQRGVGTFEQFMRGIGGQKILSRILRESRGESRGQAISRMTVPVTPGSRHSRKQVSFRLPVRTICTNIASFS